MKVKILKTFIDKDTNATMQAGATAEYEAERAEELIRKGFAEKVKAEKKEKAEATEKKTTKKKTTKKSK